MNNSSYRRVRMTAAAVAVLLLTPAQLSFAAVRPEVQAVADAYADLRYDEARTGGEELIRAGGNTLEELKTLYRVLGEVYAARGDRKKSAANLEHLIGLDPDAGADEMASPKISSAYEAARKGWAKVSPFSISHEIPTDLADGGLVLSFRLESDPFDYVKAVVVRWRVPGTASFRVLEGSDVEEVTVSIPASVLGPDAKAVEYFAVAVDEHGSVVREWGSEKAPLRVPPAAEGSGAEVEPDVPMTWTPPAVAFADPSFDLGKGRKPLLIGIAAGGAVALGIAVLVALLTQPTPRDVSVITSVRD